MASVGGTEQHIRVLKKYPNRRLYDTQLSAYVTLEDVRQCILQRETIQVLDSKTQQDITRSVLLQIIAEQETEGHEPLLTNRVLEALVRFYGEPNYEYLGRFIEQSIAGFLDQQRRYQRHMQQLIDRSPIRLMQQFADQNVNFWRSVLGGGAPGASGASASARDTSAAGASSSPGGDDAPFVDDGRPLGPDPVLDPPRRMDDSASAKSPLDKNKKKSS